MNKHSLRRALILFLPAALFGAPNRSVLVLGNSSRTENGNVIFTSSVSLICKDPDETIKVFADEIVLEQDSHLHGGTSLLRCSGETVIESGGRTIKGRDITFEFGDMRGNVYVLNPNGIILNGSGKVTSSFGASGVNNRVGSVEPAPTSFGSVTISGVSNGGRYDPCFPSDSWPENLISKPLPKFDAALPTNVENRLKLIPDDRGFRGEIRFVKPQ